MELDGRSPQDVAGEVDSTLYAVLHCQHKYFSSSQLQKQFLRKFRMSNTSDMYILPAICLVKPLLVVPDVKDHESASSSRYIVCMPRHYYGLYFKNHVHCFSDDEAESVDSDYDDEW